MIYELVKYAKSEELLGYQSNKAAFILCKVSNII